MLLLLVLHGRWLLRVLPLQRWRIRRVGGRRGRRGLSGVERGLGAVVRHLLRLLELLVMLLLLLLLQGSALGLLMLMPRRLPSQDAGHGRLARVDGKQFRSRTNQCLGIHRTTGTGLAR